MPATRPVKMALTGDDEAGAGAGGDQAGEPAVGAEAGVGFAEADAGDGESGGERSGGREQSIDRGSGQSCERGAPSQIIAPATLKASQPTNAMRQPKRT